MTSLRRTTETFRQALQRGRGPKRIFAAKTATGAGRQRIGRWLEKGLAAILAVTMCIAASPVWAQDAPPPQQQAPSNDTPPPPQDQTPPPQDQQGADQQNPVNAPPYQQQTPEQLQQLVAPIALYPDSLVAQILAASTFPEQVVEADRWVQGHPELKGDALGQAVNDQPWDPSVKALAAFPTVLGNMDKNLSWTSSLGDAYYNQQQDVMDAVQVMRKKAEESGNLKSTPQQTVTTQGQTIIVQPANPQVVYVPAYNPWVVYGPPLVAWPGWYPYPGIWFGGPYLSFGVGFGIGWFGGFGWGWGHWGFDWYHHYPLYAGARYYSHSNTFYNRNYYYRGANNFHGAPARGFEGRAPGVHAPPAGSYHGGVYNRPGAVPQPFHGNQQQARGYAAQPPRGQNGTRSGAFSNYDHGGQARSYSYRGSASMGGSHGGGSAPHGGGGGGGGHAGGGGHR